MCMNCVVCSTFLVYQKGVNIAIRRSICEVKPNLHKRKRRSDTLYIITDAISSLLDAKDSSY